MKKKLNFKKTLTNFVVISGILFALFMIIFSSISQFVYKNINFAGNFLIVLIVSVITSILLLLIFKINRISTVLQVIIVYLLLSVIVLITGYSLFIYDLIYNLRLLICTVACLVSGLIIISLAFAISYKRNDKSLNANLKNFKERDR